MPTSKFILRKAKGTSASILLHYHYGSKKRLRYATGLKISNSKNWNPKTERVRDVIEETQKTHVNNRLNEIQAFMGNLYTRLSEDPDTIITNTILSYELNQFLKRKSAGNQPLEQDDRFLEFLPFFNWYLDHFKTNPLPTTRKSLSPGTWKTYQNTYRLFKRFHNEMYNLTYKRITLDFYDDFLQYMHERNYSANYIGTSIKILKTMMNMSYEKGFHENMDYKKRYFVKPSESVNNIYLNEQELLSIFHLDLSGFMPIKLPNGNLINVDNLDRARDLFLIGANTGLRISDFNKLTIDNIVSINGNSYISIETRKTGKHLTIPINPMIQEILNKRDGAPPERMVDQYINYSIKIICQLADIDGAVTKVITKGGKKVLINLSKFEMVSSHTARRSFCTNAYKSGMPTIDIMAISGHQTEKVFYNYIKVDDIERAEKIRKHKFFTTNNFIIRKA